MINLILIAIVSLFCLNGRGMGGPVIERKSMLISDYLGEISNSCNNRFLASEIAKALESCSLPPPPPPSDKEDSATEKQLLCIMYYDINKQLCQTNLTESNFAEKYLPEVSVKDLCTESTQWTVPKIPWYPLYQSSLEGLLKDTYSCSSLCHDPNKLHHANNVCKLYKVGYDLLRQTKPITSTATQKDETSKKHVLDIAESIESVEQPVIHRDTAPADILPRKALEDVYLARNSIANPSTILQPKNETKTIPTPQVLSQVQDSRFKEDDATVSEIAKAEEQETVNKVAKVRAMTQINEPPPSELAQPIISTKSNNPVQPESKLPQAEPVDDNVREPNVPQDAVEVVEKPDEGKVKDVKNADVVAPPSPVKDVKQEDMDNWGN